MDLGKNHTSENRDSRRYEDDSITEVIDIRDRLSQADFDRRELQLLSVLANAKTLREQNQYLSLELKRSNQRNHQLENEVESLRELNYQMIDGTESYILIVDKKAKIQEYNSAVQKLTGQRTLEGKSLWEIMPELNTEWMKEALFNVIQTGSYFQSKSINCKTGDRKRSMIDVRVHPYYDHMDRIQCAMLIIDDVTEQRILEKRLIQSEKMAAIGRLSTNLAHELNNPLDGILRYVRLLLNQMPKNDSRRIYAEQARDGLMRVANMVRGLLDFARKSTPILGSIDIPQSIRRILAFFGDQISAQNIETKTEFDENVPVVLNADLEQIFMNIIKNAIQAMPTGGTLLISAKMLSPELFEARFSDTGPGIPDEIREMIFEPFFTTKDVGQGVGLGLSINQGIAENYNGSIDVESELGKGTTFIVRFPIGETGLTAQVPPDEVP